MKNLIRLTALSLLAVVMLAAVFAPVQPAYATPAERPASLSVGCEGLNTILSNAAQNGYPDLATTFVDYRNFSMVAGEQVNLVLNPVMGLDYSTTTVYMNVNGQQVGSSQVPGVLAYTIPADGLYSFYVYSNSGVLFSASGTNCGMASAEPYIETVVPALGVDLDKARLTTYNGQQPLDVFEAKWWGVKTITENKFPALAGMDLTGVEVRCLNGAGDWVDTYVSVFHNDAGMLQALVKQHGICGIFEK